MSEAAGRSSSQVWRRPQGPPSVWRIVEGMEKSEDGSTRSDKFSIQEVPDNRRNEVIEFMLKYFIADEPICKSLRKCAFQRFSTMAQALDQCTAIEAYITIITVNFSAATNASVIFRKIRI